MANSFDLIDLPTGDYPEDLTLRAVLNRLLEEMRAEGYELAYLSGISVQGVSDDGAAMEMRFDAGTGEIQMEQL